MALIPRLEMSAEAISIALFREMAGLEGLLREPEVVLVVDCVVPPDVCEALLFAATEVFDEVLFEEAAVLAAALDEAAALEEAVFDEIKVSGAKAAIAGSYTWRLRLVTFPLSAFN